MIYLLNTVLISLFSNHITSMGYGWNILDIKMPWDLRRAYEGPWFLPTTTSEDQWMRKQETNLDVGSMKLGLALDLVLFFSLFFFFSFLPLQSACIGDAEKSLERGKKAERISKADKEPLGKSPLGGVRYLGRDLNKVCRGIFPMYGNWWSLRNTKYPRNPPSTFTPFSFPYKDI